ncbi:MAG: hypothetical protein HGB26_04600 [Desulfobulbaceae bacterium]|nr:hypothetical protein [Desulfobulbaceae bacterium]
MKKTDNQRLKWEYIGHRLMQSSDLQVLCGVTRSTTEAEKPFVSCLRDHELKGMITFALERMREIDKCAELHPQQHSIDIPYEYRDRRQEYLRLQIPKSERYLSSELYNAEFINDFDEGYDTLQGVQVTLIRAFSYLFEELLYRNGSIAPPFIHALQRNYPEYVGIIEQMMAERKREEISSNHSTSIKLNLSKEQLEDLVGCLEVFFDPSDRSPLKALFQGHPVDRKLVFNGNQNRLVEVFRRLSYNGFLLETWTSIRDWFCCHFAYRSKTGITDLSMNSVWDILSKAKGEPTSKSRICMLEWLPYKTQAALKRNY